MSDAIGRFFNQPTTNHLSPRNGQEMVFLIEPEHAAAAWTVLMKNGTHFHNDLLWFGTPFQAHMAQGPSWFVVSGKNIDGMAEVCHQRPPGVALTCADPKAALAHARTLLSMRGSSVLAIQDPAIWASLAMESGSQQACLMGPWDEVFTPVPSARPAAREWHVWKSETPSVGTCQYPLVFPDSLYSTYKDIRWLHWLRQNPQQFANAPDSELPRVVSNLDFLVKHGLGVDRDLLPILTSPERPHRRLAQLLEGL